MCLCERGAQGQCLAEQFHAGIKVAKILLDIGCSQMEIGILRMEFNGTLDGASRVIEFLQSNAGHRQQTERLRVRRLGRCYLHQLLQSQC